MTPHPAYFKYDKQGRRQRNYVDKYDNPNLDPQDRLYRSGITVTCNPPSWLQDDDYTEVAKPLPEPTKPAAEPEYVPKCWGQLDPEGDRVHAKRAAMTEQQLINNNIKNRKKRFKKQAKKMALLKQLADEQAVQEVCLYHRGEWDDRDLVRPFNGKLQVLPCGCKDQYDDWSE